MMCIISEISFGFTAPKLDATPIMSNTNTFSHFRFIGTKSSGDRRGTREIRASAARRVSVEVRNAGILPAASCSFGSTEAEEVVAKKLEDLKREPYVFGFQ
jgi:hypothetical protein